MPESDRRHQRRAVAARAHARERQAANGAISRALRNPAVVAAAAIAVVVAVAAGVWLVASRPQLSTRPSASGGGEPAVSVATLAASASQNVVQPTAPEILTPTPGAAGPTAVVVTNSPWQVLIARGAVRDMTSPSGVAIDPDGNVWVVDFEGNFIQKFSTGGQPLIRFGQKGNAPGQFAGPTNLSIDGQANLYVADTNNQRIQKLSPTGQSLASWGMGGDGPGQFWLPSGVAVDDQGKIYVADRGNHRIQVLSPTGQPLAQWGTRGPAPGQFWAP